MEVFSFAAWALNGELDLNRLAGEFGISRRYRWEEPMVLDPQHFVPADPADVSVERVFLYYFGGVVFQNCSPETISVFWQGLARVVAELRDRPQLKYYDDYSLRIDPAATAAITNDAATVCHFEPELSASICFVLAKSVALERIEEQLDLVLDEVEGLIAQLDQGKLTLSDKRLAKLASSILNFKYRSIAHIMVLDKPDITWESAEVDRFYLTMATLFELNQRYGAIKHKTETLLNITEVFSSLSHARRATRLEWIIIVLIAIEIVIYVLEIAWRHP